MKKLIGSLLVVLVLATVCYAQVARNPEQNLAGKTNFTNVGVTGLDVTGNPGYLEFSYSDSLGANFPVYLWFDIDGDLCASSFPTISTFSSFPTGDWRTGMPCTKIGSQS